MRKINVVAQVEAPTLQQARRWLVANGWAPCTDQGSLEGWRLQKFCAYLPTQESFDDFAQCFETFLKRVAMVHERFAWDVCTAMKGMTDAYEAARERYVDNFFAGHQDWPAIWAMAEASLDAVACVELVVAMSEVSEEWSCATWHSGIEETLAWHASHRDSLVEERTAFLEVERAELDGLLALSAKCGGWWEWGEEQGHPVFVPGWIPPGARP